MQLIKAACITFKENPNMSTNALPNHVSGSGLVNVLEAECLGNLKVSMVRAWCEEGNMNF
jgi:hypothetical protein